MKVFDIQQLSSSRAFMIQVKKEIIL